MPKPVQMRASYRNDAAFLLRLEAAVDKDDRQNDVWRKETCNLIRQLAQRLLAAVTNGAAKRASK